MKKTVVKQRLLTRLMKMTLYQFVLALIFSTVTMANSLKGQGKLDSKVTISITDMDLNKALTELGKSADVKFSYNSRMVAFDQKVSVNADNEVLSAVLSRILKPLNITYALVSNQIVLQKAKKNNDTESSFSTIDQQQKTLSGVVVDGAGLALPGASILAKGTTSGVSTDIDGKFSIKVDSNVTTLVISYIGFDTVEIPVGTKTTFKITLNESSQTLNEVVVVGYGSQNRAAVTGAISTVKAEQIVALPVANVAEALQGRAAGVSVINTGSPGTEPVIAIRGYGSFNGSTPLYVVDGVIVGNLSGINQNDIESINVLKDASTTAVYGAKGSNGVIVVTTKKGTKGPVQVSLNVFTGIQTQNKRYDVLNTQQYLQYAKDAFGIIPTSPSSQSGVNTNWQDQIYQTGLVRNYDFGVSGGGENSSVRISGGYAEKEGIIIGTGFERYSLRANSDYTLGKLKVGESMSINFNKIKPELDSGGRSLLEHAIKAAPYLEVYNPNNQGGFQGPNTSADGQDAENGVRIMRNPTVNNRSFSFLGNLFAELEIVKDLKFKSQLGIDYYNTNNSIFTPSYDDDDLGGTHKQDYANIDKGSSFGQTLIFTNSLSYNKTFNNLHNFQFLLLSEKIETKFNNLHASSRNIVTDNIDNILTSNQQISASSSNNVYNKIGYLARINYDFDNKYLASASLRRDASSRFGPNERYGWFYSASLGWNIAKENFMDNSAFSTLKLRSSYGLSGNDNIPNYAYAAVLSSNFGYPIDGKLAAGTTINNLANPDLKWEQTNQLNLGLDIGLFKEKLTAAIEYYVNKSDNLLLNVPLPTSLGINAGSQYRNVGAVESKGFEVTLGYNDTDGDFKWSANLNLGTSKSKAKSLGGTLTELNGGDFEGEKITRITEGNTLYHYYGLVMDGIYQNQAEVDAVFSANPSQSIVKPGDIRYKDLNNDGSITNADKTIIGNALPDFTYGLNLDASYKNWDLNVFITGVQGRDLINTNLYDLEGMKKLFNAGVSVMDRWTATNPSNTIPRAGGAPQNTAISTRYLEDGSFARLKNLTIGYTLPNETFGKNYFSKCRIYVSSQNLLTLTKYSGLDPEIGNSDGFESGLDRGEFPQPKTFLVGLQLTF
ncbi:MAG: TonB-dependent receptor [Flavobacterium sp.]